MSEKPSDFALSRVLVESRNSKSNQFDKLKYFEGETTQMINTIEGAVNEWRRELGEWASLKSDVTGRWGKEFVFGQ